MPNYRDSAQECFQSAQNDPWHSSYYGRYCDYHNLSLTLHYAKLFNKAPYRSRYKTDEDAIARSAGEWWFYDLRECDKIALTSVEIGIEDFMKAKYQCDIRACFSDDEYCASVPPKMIGGHYYNLPDALSTFKESLEQVISRNVTADLVERASKERWYSEDTIAFDNAKRYYKSFCEGLLGITAINKLGGINSCGVPQASNLRKLDGVDLLPDRTLLDDFLEIPPGRWAMVIGIPLDRWSAIGIDPLWTKAVLTPSQWKAIARTRYPYFLEKFAVKSGLTVYEV